MKKISKKGQEKDRRVKQAKREIREERPHICQGCWSKKMPFLDCSHRISLSFDKWASDKNNMDLYCRNHDGSGCHDDWQQGRVWKLLNGEKAMDWIRSVNEERFYQKLYQMNDRFKEDKPDDIPEWASRMLCLIN